MKTITFTILIVSQIFYFCSQNVTELNENNFVLSDTLILSYKQVYSNSANGISIKFDSLLNDSRCPVDVICVWAGDAELKFAFSNRNENVNFNLHTNGKYFTRDTLLLDSHIELLDVYPYPHSEKEIRAEDYEAKVVINKVNED